MKTDAKGKLRRAKMYIYLLLAVATIIFANRSYVYFKSELESRILPQIMRATNQVSMLLPQLEKNEEAVREMHEDLENSRRKIYAEHKAAPADSQQNGNDPEAVISQTLSWMNRVTKLRVGSEGSVVVISQEDGTILAHSDERFVGETLSPVGKADMAAVYEISESDVDKLSQDLWLFFPKRFFRNKIGVRRFFEAARAGIFGKAFSYKDTYILCGVTLEELMTFVAGRCFFTTLIFFAAAWILVRFIIFSLMWKEKDFGGYRTKIVSYSFFAIVILFLVTWYYGTTMDLTGDLATMNQHARIAVETLNTYREYRDELSKWLDSQYLQQCTLARDMVAARGKANLTRAELAEFAKELGIRYIYVYDKNGRVVITNSPYDHLRIPSSEEDPLYQFRQLLDGRESLILEPQKNEYGENLQYIGVSLRDQNDLADGFVQIAVDPSRREQLLAPVNVGTVLENMVIGLPDYALAVDKATEKVIASTGLVYTKTSIEDLGIDVKALETGLNRTIVFNGITYYTAVSETEDLYLIPLARSTDNAGSFSIAFKLTLWAALAIVLLVLQSLYCYKQIAAAAVTEGDPEAEESARKTDGGEKETEKQGLFSWLTGAVQSVEKYNFETRWRSQKAIPVEEQPPEMRVRKTMYYMLLIFSVGLLLYEGQRIYTGAAGERLDGFSYVLLGNWEKGVNVFALTYCVFLACVLYVFQELLNQILYRLAKVSDLRNETILLLLRNALKYGMAIVFLYVGLAKFGVDTRALWASAGVLSLMVGFGAKDLVSDIIAGLFIIFEGTYKIGDFVTVGSWRGMVEEIGLRYTKISYFANTKIINNSSVRDIVNCDGEADKQSVQIPVPYEMKLEDLEALLERELPLISERLPGIVRPPKYNGVSSFDENGLTINIDFFCEPTSSSKAQRALRREIKLLFDREHIKMPCRHVVVKEEKEADEP